MDPKIFSGTFGAEGLAGFPPPPVTKLKNHLVTGFDAKTITNCRGDCQARACSESGNSDALPASGTKGTLGALARRRSSLNVMSFPGRAVRRGAWRALMKRAASTARKESGC